MQPDADGPAPKKPESGVSEVLSPLRALLKARGARGSQAVGDLRTSDIFEFRLIQRRVPLPLGWLLSERSRIAIDRATQYEGGNLWARRQIGDLLYPNRPSSVPVDAVAVRADASEREIQKENL